MSARCRSRAKYWDSVVESWRDTPGASLLRAYSDETNRILFEAWLPPSSDRILKTDAFDEAVGEGLLSVLTARATHVSVIDVSRAALARARQRHPTVEAILADVRALPFARDSVDVAVSNSTLDHFTALDDVEAGLRELHRVLVPGGLLLLTLDNPWNPLVAIRNVLPTVMLRRAGLVPYDIGRTCGPRRLRALLEAAGFDVEHSTAVMHVPRLLVRAFGGLPGKPRAALLRILVAVERAEGLPTSYVTGQFVAVVARARPTAS